jgi:hypothetical protein
LLQLDLIALVPQFTTSKVDFKLSDAEAQGCCGWYLHGGLYQRFV